jgi:hypothetical protein
MKSSAYALLVLLAAGTAAADTPQVDVRFVVEAQQFIDGLGSARASVERAVTQTLLDECRDQKSFPFLRWMNGDSAAPNRLVVALVQKKTASDFEMRIEYRASTKDGSLPPALQETVYEWWAPKFSDSPSLLKARLQSMIHADFAGDAFRRNLLGYFVSRIPLAETVDLAGHKVLVQVPGKELQAKEDESELEVSFFRKSDGMPGMMTLGDPLDFPARAAVICSIKQLNFEDLLLTDGWNDRIPRSIGPSKVRDVRVTMRKYVPKWLGDSNRGAVTSD